MFTYNIWGKTLKVGWWYS